MAIKALSSNKQKAPKGVRLALVVSQYHSHLTNRMASACKQVLIKSGVAENKIDILTAPGSWEVALITEMAALSKKYDGIAAFGILLKGETYHFDLIANEVARSLMNTSVRHQIPVAFEILAVHNIKQAELRCAGEHNKGIEAANALIASINTIKKL